VAVAKGPTFVGSVKCKECHDKIYATWRQTVHARAVQEVTRRGRAIPEGNITRFWALASEDDAEEGKLGSMQTSGGRLGILVGGGPAPGINSAISAAAIEAVNENLEVIGIYDGYEHLMHGRTDGVRPLSITDVSRIHFQGAPFCEPRAPIRPASQRTCSVRCKRYTTWACGIW